MEQQHHLIKCAVDCAFGFSVFISGLAGWLGWLDSHVVPYVATWGGAILVIARLVHVFIIEPIQSRKKK